MIQGNIFIVLSYDFALFAILMKQGIKISLFGSEQILLLLFPLTHTYLYNNFSMKFTVSKKKKDLILDFQKVDKKTPNYLKS